MVFGVILFSAMIPWKSAHKIWLCYDFAFNGGLYWIVIFYKADFKIAHVRRFTLFKLSFAFVCYR